MSNFKKKDLVRILSLGYLPPVNDYIPVNSQKNEEFFSYRINVLKKLQISSAWDYRK